MSTEHDYDLTKKVKIQFKGMDYYVMPRYKDHYLNHEYERFSLQVLKNNLNESSTFVDIGAHYGAYSLYAAHESGSSVIAIEPVVENMSLLNDNVKVNKLGNKITTYEYAASDSNGEAEFNIPWASDSAGFYNHPNAETIRKQKVITKKIDDVIYDGRVDIIKIDTEGHELGVLRGLKQTLKKNPLAQLIIEINPPLLEAAGSSAEALLEMIRGFDKEIYMIDEDKFTMHRITNRLDSWPRYINEGNYANLYCVPAKGHQYALFVSHTAQIGGAELAMLEQIVELRKRNVISHVVLPGKGALETYLIERGIGYSIIPEYSFWIGYSQKNSGRSLSVLQKRNLNNMNAAAAIADIAKEIDPTIVINNSMVNPWGYAAARALGLPLAWMIHEFGDLDHKLPFAHGLAATRDFILEESDLVLCCSDAVRRHLLGHMASDKTHVLYNFLDFASVVEKSKQPTKGGFSKKAGLKLCTVGMLSEGKGQADVIDALAVLKKQGVDAELLLVGPSQTGYETVLKERAKTAGVANAVTFLGFTDNPYSYIKAADVVVVASRNEAFGRVAAEAMALGVVVVVARSGGSLELVQEGKTGLTYTASDPNDLARAIRKASSLSAKEKNALIALAQARLASLLDVSKNADELNRLIAKVTGKHLPHYSNIMVPEWINALAAMKDEVQRLQSELLEAQDQAKGQKQINIDQAKILSDIVGSKSYKLSLKLAKAKNAIKPKRA